MTLIERLETAETSKEPFRFGLGDILGMALRGEITADEAQIMGQERARAIDILRAKEAEG